MEQTMKQGSAAKGSLALAVFAVVIAAFMAVLDSSIVNIAIPKMEAVFSATTSEIQWVVTAYFLTTGVITPVTGYLSERFGSKTVLMAALIIFTISSGLCGAAWSTGSLIFFRILQAIGGGMIMPVAMTIMLGLFPPQRRGLAMGITGIAIMFAPAVGPTLSGYITEYLDWRLIFYINLPIGIVDLLLISFLIHNQVFHAKKSFDFLGFIFSTIGFSTLLYGFSEGPSKGWTSLTILSCLFVAFLSLIIFVAIELRSPNPMLDIKIFKDGNFTLSMLILSIVTIALFGGIFLLPLFMQNIQGLSAVQTGLVLLPSALASGVMMPIAGNLTDKFGAKYSVIAGLVVMVITSYFISRIDVKTSYQSLTWLMTIRGFGLGATMMPISTAAYAFIKPQKIPQATALNNTVRNVAGSIGIAILTSILNQRNIFHSDVLSSNISLTNPLTVSSIKTLTSGFMAKGMSAAQAQMAAIAQIYGQVKVASFVNALDDVLLITTLISAVALLSAFLIRNTKRKKEGSANAAAPILE